MIEQLIQTFCEETEELLAELETSLLELKRQPCDAELVDRIFRAMHTIKGSSAMFGFEAMAALSHEVETILDLFRSGSLHPAPEIIALILRARDRLKEMLLVQDGSAPEDSDVSEIVAAIRLIAIETEQQPAPDTALPNVATEGAATTYTITFRPDRDIFKRGLMPQQILNELRNLGTCRITALTDEIPLLADIDPELCYLGWEIDLTTAVGSGAVNDAFMFVGDDSRIEIRAATDGENPPPLSGEQPASTDEKVDLPERVVELGGAGKTAISGIRVAATKLDQLVNLVGELVTVQARLSQMSAARNDTELVGLAEEMERLTAGLRNTALDIRMIPIGSTFGRFRRLVHDLAFELGKEVELVTTGAETELDKTVIEKLGDPLVHLIRNCIDHGIEFPARRLAEGKAAAGTISLSALHSGDSVLITIGDDGCGIDRDGVRARAEINGLIPAGVDLPDQELLNLIFAPGLSTAETITSISGRGVGMDVVKKGVDALRGAIAVTSSPGAGTVVTIRIPLTLAIIESLLVRVGTDYFVLPLTMVQECIELTGEDIARAHGRHLASVRGRITPYIPLRQRFGIGGDRPEIEQIVIVELGGRQVGLVVDHVIGEHQTVIKSIGRMFRQVTGISGATILGDGAVALILDVQQLITEEERAGESVGTAIFTEESHGRAIYA